MDIRALEVFVAVVEQGHFGRAGQQVFMSQSGVTRAIKRLESDFDVRLLERGGQGVQLTPAGTALLPWARRMLGLAQRAREAVAQSSRGAALIVGVSHTSSLLTQRFSLTAGPVQLRHVASAQQLAALREGRCDVVVSVSAIREADVTCHPLGYERYYGLMPVSHPLAAEPALSFAQWLRQPQIILSILQEPGLSRLVSGHARDQGIEHLDFVEEVDDMLQLFEAVSAGRGFAAVPRSWAQIRHEGVVSRPLPDPAQLMTFGMFLSANSDARIPLFLSQAQVCLGPEDAR
ncbi:MAG: LysR family transcriptional regulator [Myxococcota bacterium]